MKFETLALTPDTDYTAAGICFEFCLYMCTQTAKILTTPTKADEQARCEEWWVENNCARFYFQTLPRGGATRYVDPADWRMRGELVAGNFTNARSDVTTTPLNHAR